MATHNDFGKYGEQLAIAFLLQKDYTILHQNWYFQKAEIDIIAQKNDELIVVEVKSRQSNTLENGENAVNTAKKKLLVKAANAYIEKYQLDLAVRFDIITVVIHQQKPQIKHLKNAFTAFELS